MKIRNNLKTSKVRGIKPASIFNKKKIANDKKLVLIIILAAVIAILWIMEPIKGKVSFNIEDKCGEFINVVSHTIDDEGVCKTRCRSQCESIDYKYLKVEFRKRDNGCNSCVCHCK